MLRGNFRKIFQTHKVWKLSIQENMHRSFDSMVWDWWREVWINISKPTSCGSCWWTKIRIHRPLLIASTSSHNANDQISGGPFDRLISEWSKRNIFSNEHESVSFCPITVNLPVCQPCPKWWIKGWKKHDSFLENILKLVDNIYMI